MLILSSIPFRSLSDGNCLFSSISRQLIGDDSLIHDLRVLSSEEPHDCADYYSKHPLFLKILEENDIFLGKTV